MSIHVNRDKNSGFTLIEVVVSVTIGALVLLGITFFVSKVNTEIASSKNRTQIHVEVANLLERMNGVRTNYSSGTVIWSGSTAYSTLLFANTGSTSGVLVGVVNADAVDASGNTLLDQTGSYATYGNKVVGVQELTKIQLQSVQSNPANAWAIPFRADKLYPTLDVQSFSVVPYNSGSVFDLDMSVYEANLTGQKGKAVASVSTPDILDIHLNF